MRKTMAKQLADFDNMKKKLMKDLQDRCERVVELEISLEESKEAVIICLSFLILNPAYRRRTALEMLTLLGLIKNECLWLKEIWIN